LKTLYKYKYRYFVAWFFAVIILIHPKPLYPKIVEKIIGSINGKIFTLSDCEIERKFLLGEIVFENLKSENILQYLEKLIDAELIYREGKMLKIIHVSEDEVKNRIEYLIDIMGDEFYKELTRFEISKKDLAKLIREKIYAKKYFELRRNFFKGFGEEEGKIKMDEWIKSMRKKAGFKLLI